MPRPPHHLQAQSSQSARGYRGPDLTIAQPKVQIHQTPLPLFTKPHGNNTPELLRTWTPGLSQRLPYMPEPFLNLAVMDSKKTKPQLISELELLRGGGKVISNLQGLRSDNERLASQFNIEADAHSLTKKAMSSTQTALATTTKFSEDLKAAAAKQLRKIDKMKTVLQYAENEIKVRDTVRAKLESHVWKLNGEKAQLTTALVSSKYEEEKTSALLQAAEETLAETQTSLEQANENIVEMQAAYEKQCAELTGIITALQESNKLKDIEIERLKNEAYAMEMQLRGEIEQLETHLALEQRKVQKAEEENTKLNVLIVEQQQELIQLRPLVGQLEDALSNIETLEKNIEALEQQIATLEEEKNDLISKLAEEEERGREKDRQIAELQGQLASSIEKLNAEIEGRRADNEAAAEEQARLEQEIEKRDNIIEERDRQIEVHQKEIEELKEEIAKLRVEMSVLREEIKGLQTDIANLKHEMATLGETIAQLEKKKAELEQQIIDNEETHKEEVDQLQQEHLRAMKAALDEQLALHNEKLTALREEHEGKVQELEKKLGQMADNLEVQRIELEEKAVRLLKLKEMAKNGWREEEELEDGEQGIGHTKQHFFDDDPYSFPPMILKRDVLSTQDSLQTQLSAMREKYRTSSHTNEVLSAKVHKLQASKHRLKLSLGELQLSMEPLRQGSRSESPQKQQTLQFQDNLGKQDSPTPAFQPSGGILNSFFSTYENDETDDEVI